MGGIPRGKEGLFESLFITHAAAPNLPHHLAYFEINECTGQRMQVYAIKPLPHSALPLNPGLECFSEFEAVDREWIDSP